jgi:hypothetical protein
MIRTSSQRTLLAIAKYTPDCRQKSPLIDRKERSRLRAKIALDKCIQFQGSHILLLSIRSAKNTKRNEYGLRWDEVGKVRLTDCCMYLHTPLPLTPAPKDCNHRGRGNLSKNRICREGSPCVRFFFEYFLANCRREDEK